MLWCLRTWRHFHFEPSCRALIWEVLISDQRCHGYIMLCSLASWTYVHVVLTLVITHFWCPLGNSCVLLSLSYVIFIAFFQPSKASWLIRIMFGYTCNMVHEVLGYKLHKSPYLIKNSHTVSTFILYHEKQTTPSHTCILPYHLYRYWRLALFSIGKEQGAGKRAQEQFLLASCLALLFLMKQTKHQQSKRSLSYCCLLTIHYIRILCRIDFFSILLILSDNHHESKPCLRWGVCCAGLNCTCLESPCRSQP